MKRIFKYLSVLIFSLAIFLLPSIHASAAGVDTGQESVHTVTQSGGGYLLTASDGVQKFDTLGKLLSESGEKKLMLVALRAEESLTVSGDVTLSGSLDLTGSLSFESGSVKLKNMSLEVSSGTVEIRDAEVIAESSKIALEGASVIMNYSSASVFEMRECELVAKTERPALEIEMGTARIIDTKLISEHSYAISNSGSLYLSGNSEACGFGWDVFTSRPVHLSYEKKALTAPLSVLWDGEFSKGGFYKVFLDCDSRAAESVSLSSSKSESCPLTYFEKSDRCPERSFIAVSLPYKFTYYASGEKYLEEYYYADELTVNPGPAHKDGYRFILWNERQTDTELSFGTAPSGDVVADASFSLLAPTYSIADVKAVWGEDNLKLAFDYISHPLLSEGSVSYSWYKNEEPINSSLSEVNLESVSDSGEYFCKLTFAYKGDIMTVNTKTVTVEISKMQVKIPVFEPLVYNGSVQFPTVDSEYYYATPQGERDCGVYPVTLVLKDTLNTVWQTGQTSVEYAVFEIVKAQNYFEIAPEAKDVYEGTELSITYAAAFGKGCVLYSADGVDYSADIPLAVGKYYAVVTVEGTENYSALTSSAITFNILADTPSALLIERLPYKLEYLSFDTPDLTGIVLKAVMKSGAERYVDPSEIRTVYANGSYLSSCDGCVYLEYRTSSVPIQVSVKRRKYSLSDFAFESKEVVYNGKRHTVAARGSVVGLDGIALTYEIVGGGINVGEYEIRAVFSTESHEYEIPADAVTTLKILPMPITLDYRDTAFVYDGTPKIPSASFTDAGGALRRATLNGAKTSAGEYVAEAVITDSNYSFLNPTVAFVIEKAEIDVSSVEFTRQSFVYNGEKQSVSVSKLPPYLSVVGYINASFADVGKYVAEAIVEYDSENYQKPDPILFEWEILPAEYELGDFLALDCEYVYDGAEHYPKTSGSLPRGKDGSVPEYRFSGGASHVSEGWVTVSLIFSSSSKNYNAPEPIEARVRITPKPIVAMWSDTEFTYDGEEKIPYAYSSEAEISVSGGGTNAGEYTATATSESTDYKVVNSKVSYRIKKAENAWVEYPSVLSAFFGKDVKMHASAVSGEVKFKVYTDENMQSEAQYPLCESDYFLFAYVEEGENYLRLSSGAVKFSVVPVAPTGLEITILKDSFTAFDTVCTEDFEAVLKFNDGSEQILDGIDVAVDIGSQPLKKGENPVRFSYLEFDAESVIDAVGRELDMSGAYWDNTEHVYSAEPKSATLEGLPEGVRVAEYILNSATKAGTYILSCKIEYDSDYYLEPMIPEGYLVIKKAPVVIPDIPSFIYNGAEQIPDFPKSELYTIEALGAKRAGDYEVKITLTDPENYTLGDTVVKYSILPREIELKLKADGKSYTVISGEIAEGDILGEEYYTENGMYLLRISNPDYIAKVVGTEKIEGGAVLIFILLIIIIALAVYVLIGRRDLVFAMGKRSRDFAPDKPAVKQSAPKAEPKKEVAELGNLFKVDEESANRLISDMLAKDLVKEERKKIRTDGRRRGFVNIGKISENYEHGARVDINSLKEKGLVGKDVCRIKVLGGGTVDKPLHIMANSFSLSAVKMIALTGGTAERVINIK